MPHPRAAGPARGRATIAGTSRRCAPSARGIPLAGTTCTGFYAAFGVAPAPQHPDIEDHVGAELEFMSVLALKEAHALAEGHGDGVAVTRHAQATFLAEHLARWADAFAARVRALAAPGFYAAAAALLGAWIDRECVTLSATPTKVDVPAAAEDAPLSCPMAPSQAPEDHP
jgi:hypothetical protein